MIRIYFDSNIFRFLKKNDSVQFQDLNKKLIKYKDKFLYCYSHAHLLDLQRDSTDKKYEDLTFMETLVENNYICQYADENQPNIYLGTPLEAFDRIDNIDITSTFKELEEIVSSSGSQELIEQYKILSEQSISISPVKFEELHPDVQNMLKLIIPTGETEFSLKKWLEYFGNFYNDLHSDKGPYKYIRGYTVQQLNLKKFDIAYDSINFNEDLKKTPIGKTFIEFVINSINPDGKKEVTPHDFFSSAFLILNIIGVDDESNKKAKFPNTFNDGQHGYYGACCDYIVSDDDGFLKKAKLVYKLLDINTKVLSIDEFCNSIDFLAAPEENDISTFLEILRHEISTGLVLKSKQSLKYKRKTTTIKSNHLYFGLFNRIDWIVEDKENSSLKEKYIVLYNYRGNYSRFSTYKEFKSVTNKMIKLLGMDYDFRGEFSEKDLKELNSNTWEGRRWLLDQIKIALEVNQGTGELDVFIANFS